jgi:hypothetical protein
MEESKSVVVDLSKGVSATAPAPETQAGVDISKLTDEQKEQLEKFVAGIKSRIHMSRHAGQKKQSKAGLQQKKEHKKKIRKIALASKRANRK